MTQRFLAALACIFLLCAPARAFAAGFDVPAGPISEALVALALKAHISLIDPQVCIGRTPGVRGAAGWREALSILLRGADCGFELIDPVTVRVTPRPARSARPVPPLPPAPPALIAELVVTSPQGAEDAARRPAGTTSVNGARFASFGMTDASDLKSLVAGVMSTNLGPGRDKTMLRGLSDSAFVGAGRVAVGSYLDDMPLAFNEPDPDLRLTDVERLDVTRGPQGAIFAAGEPSGAVRVVTNKPELDAFSARAGAVEASIHHGGHDASLEAMLNLPVLRGRLGLRAVAYDEVQGGFIRDIERQGTLIDRTTRSGARLAVRWQLDDSWRVDLAGVSQRLATGDTHYLIPTPAFPRRQRRVRETHSNAIDEISLSLEGSGEWGRFWAAAGFVHHAFASIYDASMWRQLGPQAGPASYFEPTAVSQEVAQLRYSSPPASRLRWLTGLYISNGEQTSKPELQQSVSLITHFQERRRDRTFDGAVYGQASYELTPDWTVTLGARAFVTRADLQSDVIASGRAQRRRLHLLSREILPMAMVQRRLPGDGQAYLLYSEAQRMGGLNSPGLGRARAPSSFAPDRLENLELGAQFHFLDGRASVRSALFYDRWLNLQAQEYSGAGGLFVTNIGDARNLGFGMEAEFAPTSRLTLAFQAQATSASLDRRARSVLPKAATVLPGIAAFAGGGLIEYRQPLARDLTLSIAAQASYLGRSHLTLDAHSPQMGGFYADRLMVDLQSSRWSAGLFVDNIGNGSGNTFSFGNPFSLGRQPQWTPQRPRTIGLRFTAST